MCVFGSIKHNLVIFTPEDLKFGGTDFSPLFGVFLEFLRKFSALFLQRRGKNTPSNRVINIYEREKVYVGCRGYKLAVRSYTHFLFLWLV